jgi:hypothetical protein
LRDAVQHAIGANASHRLRRSNYEMRKAVHAMLNDEEWRRHGNREIASQCCVSLKLANVMRNGKVDVTSTKKEKKASANAAGKDDQVGVTSTNGVQKAPENHKDEDAQVDLESTKCAEPEPEQAPVDEPEYTELVAPHQSGQAPVTL